MSPESKQSDIADTEMLHAVARGDERAFASLYDLYSPILFGLLLRILHSRAEAEDVLQEVFLQIWQRASQFDSTRGRPFTWMVTLARSRAIDRLRSSSARERAVVAATGVPSGQSGEMVTASDALEETWRGEQRAVVEGALAAIPDEQRRALFLAYFEGLTQTEIAERLREPLGTVKTRMRAGMMKLRELLREKAKDMRLGL